MNRISRERPVAKQGVHDGQLFGILLPGTPLTGSTIPLYHHTRFNSCPEVPHYVQR